MPVRRFRSAEEMPAPRHVAGSSALMAAIRGLWEFSDRVAPQRFPPGVYKHRSIEDAARRREAWAAENLRRNRSVRDAAARGEEFAGPRPDELP